MNSNTFFIRNSKLKTAIYLKYIFQLLSKMFSLRVGLAMSLILVFGVGSVWGQTSIASTNTFVTTSWDNWNGTAPTGFTQNSTYIGTAANTTGGTYAIASSGLGWQASSSVTSLSVVGTFRNTTGSIQTSVTFEYDAFQIINRTSRTPGWTVTSSLGTVSALNWTFDNTKSASSPAVLSVTLTGLNIANNGTFTVTWASDRGAGAGSSPLIGLRNVKVKFNAVTNYIVTYNANNGSGSMANQSASSATALTFNTFTRTGYTFAGWNTAANGSGTAYTDGASFPFTANTTLYAQWTAISSNNCPSGTSISPTTDQTVCQDISTSNIATTVLYSGGTGTPTDSYQWYYNTTNSNTISGATAVSGATSASLSPPSTSNEVGTRYYFCVAYATDNSCAQSATNQSLASSPVKIVVNGIPAAPTGSATQSMCTGQIVSNLNATGTAIKWYSASSGGSALNSSSVLSSTNYYASQTVNGCESSNRLAVSATVNAIPAAPSGNSSQAFCSGNTVSNLNATGTAIKWYSASSGGSALTGTSALSTTNYYASQTVSGCESSNRLGVAATVNSISIPTNLVSSNANCSSFDLSWDAVNCASGYKLDVSDSFTFSKSNVTYSEGFESTGTFPPSGWINSNWSISSTANDIYSGTYAATASSSTGTLTTKLISNPTKVTFYLGRTTNSTIKDLVIEVSTTSQTTGFTTVQTFNHSNVPSNTYQKYEVDLSSYSTFSNVYIRFRKASSTSSPWRLDDIDFYTLVPYFIPNYNDKPISSNSTSISGLSPNTKYYYRVRSTDGSNTSANSNIDSISTPALVLTTDGIIAPFCFGTATTSSLTYTAANDNPNSYSIDWNATANTAGLNDQAATSFTSSASGGTISSIAISSNVPAGTYNGIMTITNTAGCSITNNVSITINALPTITITSSPSSAIVCSGSNVSLTATGASSYSWSGGISNGTSFAVSTPTTYTVTGTDANGCSATASQLVNYYPASSSVVLASSNVSGAVEQCTESDGFTYYANPASPGQYLFGIYKNGHNFSANVSINVDNVNKYRKTTSSNGANQEHASYTLSRYWNVSTTGTVGSGIKIRFFVDPQDITDMLNQRDADYNILKNTTNINTLAVISGTEYFKTQGSFYNPASWIGNRYSGTLIKLIEDAVGTLNGQTYVELSGISSFSGGTIGAAFGPSSNNFFNSSGIVGLPVTWKDVKATAKETGNHIEWATSSEKNTKSFVVEYSYDAKAFFEASKEILAAGNSATDKFYEFNHDEEFGEMVYYRIKQIDLDGKIDYSNVVYVRRSENINDFQVSMYPVPINQEFLNLKIRSNEEAIYQIKITNMLGNEVYKESVEHTSNEDLHKINISSLTKGIYTISLISNKNSYTQQFTIID